MDKNLIAQILPFKFSKSISISFVKHQAETWLFIKYGNPKQMGKMLLGNVHVKEKSPQQHCSESFYI